MSISKKCILAAVFIPFYTLAGSTASVQINLSGTLIEPPSCTINLGGEIAASFGNDVMTTRIDGAQYKKVQLPYAISCDGDMTSFSTMQVTINGTAAGFGNGLLQTTKQGLAVQFIANGSNYPINSYSIDYDYISGTAPVIEAVLAKDATTTLIEGGFTATANMNVSYR